MERQRITVPGDESDMFGRIILELTKQGLSFHAQLIDDMRGRRWEIVLDGSY